MNSPNTKKKTPELDEDVISKSELKRQMHKLQKLGEKLVDLPNKKLNALSISDELHEAIALVREMKNDNGRRRQLQRIGKLMRFEDIGVIEAELNNTQKQDKQHQAALHRKQVHAQTIYQSLINEGNQALTRFIEQYPHANRQRLRQLIAHICRENKKAPTEEHNTKNAKRLLSEITSTLQEQHTVD